MLVTPDLIRYRVCLPDYDETHWEDAQASDPSEAAEFAARARCSRDPECYRSFEDPGMIVMVKDNERTHAYRVTVEMVPKFSAKGI